MRSTRPAIVRNAPLLVALCAAFLLALVPSALALDTTNRTDAQIQSRWQQLQPTYTGSPYTVSPSTHAPYAPGAVAAGFTRDGLNALNYCRFLAGLPDDVALDSTYDNLAQHGAVLLAASAFSHTPSKPADMDQAFYNLGEKATSSSNIGVGHLNLPSFMFECMADADTSNIGALGHRRWILDPPLAKTGLGYADQRSDAYVLDFSRTTAVSYDAIKWPCAGAFPAEMFSADTPWSVTFNPTLYNVSPTGSAYRVTLKREGDGRTWSFTSADTDPNGEFFKVETSGYGVANCVIFRPDPSSVGAYHTGDVFDVSISGGLTRRSDGKPATVTYATRFMSQEGPASSVRLAGAARTKMRRTYSLTGLVTPAYVGARVQVSLSRCVNGKWKYTSVREVTLSGGRFTYRFKPSWRGKWRAVVRYGGLSTASFAYRTSSATKTFSVN
jgi:uncharacterized protein YkwD